MIFRKKDRQLLQRVELLLLCNLEIPRLIAEEEAARAERDRIFSLPLTGTEQEVQAVIDKRRDADEDLTRAVNELLYTQYTYKRAREDYLDQSS